MSNIFSGICRGLEVLWLLTLLQCLFYFVLNQASGFVFSASICAFCDSFLVFFFHFGFYPYFNTVFSLDACWFSNENQKEIHMGERWEVWRNKEFGGITVTILYKKVSLNKWKILSPPHIHTTENGYLKLQDKKCQVTEKGRPTRMSSVHSPETFKARRVGKAIPSSERLHRPRLLDPMKWSIKIEGDRKTFRDFF